MTRSSSRLMALGLALSALLGTSAVSAAGGPYTIRGVVLGVDGKPVANWPMRISPIMPNANVTDWTNRFYKIPNYDDHLTTTDANGQFEMTNVVDYPEVKHHKYRVWSGGADTEAKRLAVNPYLQVDYLIDLSQLESPEVYLVIKSAPCAALKLVVKDAQGRPYNGSLSVAVLGGAHLQPRTAIVKDGVWIAPSIPAGTSREMGRLIVLHEKTNDETKQRIFAAGKDFSLDILKEEGVILDKRVQLLPFQTTVAEVVVPEGF